MRMSIDSMLNIEDPSERLLKQLMQVNTHKNPEYVRAESLGYDTDGIDPLIEDFYYDPKRNLLRVPRGLVTHFDMKSHPLIDNRVKNPVQLNDTGIILRKYQDDGFTQLGDASEGVIVAPTGGGKTVIGMTLIERKKQKTIIFVHTSELMKQWRKVVTRAFGFEPGCVGGDFTPDTSKPITIAMLQSGNANILKINPEEYGLALVDEGHHTPASTFSWVLDHIPAHYRYALTATPDRTDNLQQILYNRIGPIRVNIPLKVVEEAGGVLPAKVERIRTGLKPKVWKSPPPEEDNRYPKPYLGKVNNWNDYLQAISDNAARNRYIGQLATTLSQKAPTLILTDRIEHAEAMAEFCDALVLHGGLNGAERDAAMEAIHSRRLTIGTTGLLGEGIDVSGWENLILATPISAEGRMVQVIGRVIRPGEEDKFFGRIFEIVDDHPIAEGSARKRDKIYAARGYPVTESGVDVIKWSHKGDASGFTRAMEKCKVQNAEFELAKPRKGTLPAAERPEKHPWPGMRSLLATDKSKAELETDTSTKAEAPKQSMLRL